jgi:hypothetical protein
MVYEIFVITFRDANSVGRIVPRKYIIFIIVSFIVKKTTNK